MKTKQQKKDKLAPARSEGEKRDQMEKNAEVFVAKNLKSLYKIEVPILKPKKTINPEKAKETKKGQVSTFERKKIEKLRKNLTQTSSKMVLKKVGPSVLLTHAFDIWGSEPIETEIKPVIIGSTPIVNPAVILPLSGQSYNPKLDSHLNLIKKTVESEELKIKPLSSEIKERRQKRKLEKAALQINSAANKFKIDKMGKDGKRHYLEAMHQRLLKKRVNEEGQIDNIMNAQTNKIRKLNLRHEERLKGRTAKIQDIQTGKIRDYRLRNSRFNLPETKLGDFVLPAEVPKSLKDASFKICDGVRDRFDSIYRRGLIEFRPIGKAQRNSRFKLHNKTGEKDVFIQ